MELIISTSIVMAVIGALFGFGLALASEKFKVFIDHRVKSVEENLPGANCGACGYTGCPKYAQAVIKENAAPNLCRPGGKDVTDFIGKILGVEVEERVKQVAVFMCRAKETENPNVVYSGVKSCEGDVLIQDAPQKKCEFGCIGLGDCVKVCPTNAIVMNSRTGLPEIIEEKCIACGKCVEACPRKLFEMRDISNNVYVVCKNCDKGKEAKSKCANPCIACKKCEKICPYDAIHIENNLAVIDYEKCTSCAECVKVCPSNIIKDYGNYRS